MDGTARLPGFGSGLGSGVVSQAFPEEHYAVMSLRNAMDQLNDEENQVVSELAKREEHVAETVRKLEVLREIRDQVASRLGRIHLDQTEVRTALDFLRGF